MCARTSKSSLPHTQCCSLGTTAPFVWFTLAACEPSPHALISCVMCLLYAQTQGLSSSAREAVGRQWSRDDPALIDIFAVSGTHALIHVRREVYMQAFACTACLTEPFRELCPYVTWFMLARLPSRRFACHAVTETCVLPAGVPPSSRQA